RRGRRPWTGKDASWQGDRPARRRSRQIRRQARQPGLPCQGQAGDHRGAARARGGHPPRPRPPQSRLRAPGGGLTLRADDLVEAGLVAPERLDELRRVAEQFTVALTDEMATLIDPADPVDPIAAQFVPNAAELDAAPEEQADPIGDERWSPIAGIVHRYPDRVLLKPSLLCPVYCRFCFRREQIGAKGAVLGQAALDRAFAYIREHSEVWEVVITGGDPFLLAPRRVGSIVQNLVA